MPGSRQGEAEFHLGQSLSCNHHLRVKKIKQKSQVKEEFSPVPIIVNKLKVFVENIVDKKKASPISVLKQSEFTYETLEDCINSSFETAQFPDSLKLVTLIHKNKSRPIKKYYIPLIIHCLYCQKYFKE